MKALTELKLQIQIVFGHVLNFQRVSILVNFTIGMKENEMGLFKFINMSVSLAPDQKNITDSILNWDFFCKNCY